MANKQTLNIKSFGLALGSTCGLGAFILGILAWQFNIGNSLVELCSSLYIGYSASLIGSIIGGIEGFLDGFIGGILIAWLYNYFQTKWQ